MSTRPPIMGQADVGWLQEICWAGGGVEQSSIKLGLAKEGGEVWNTLGTHAAPMLPCKAQRKSSMESRAAPRTKQGPTAWPSPVPSLPHCSRTCTPALPHSVARTAYPSSRLQSPQEVPNTSPQSILRPDSPLPPPVPTAPHTPIPVSTPLSPTLHGPHAAPGPQTPAPQHRSAALPLGRAGPTRAGPPHDAHGPPGRRAPPAALAPPRGRPPPPPPPASPRGDAGPPRGAPRFSPRRPRPIRPAGPGPAPPPPGPGKETDNGIRAAPLLPPALPNCPAGYPRAPPARPGPRSPAAAAALPPLPAGPGRARPRPPRRPRPPAPRRTGGGRGLPYGRAAGQRRPRTALWGRLVPQPAPRPRGRQGGVAPRSPPRPRPPPWARLPSRRPPPSPGPTRVGCGWRTRAWVPWGAVAGRCPALGRRWGGRCVRVGPCDPQRRPAPQPGHGPSPWQKGTQRWRDGEWERGDSSEGQTAFILLL